MRKRFSLCKKVGVFLLTAVMCTSQLNVQAEKKYDFETEYQVVAGANGYFIAKNQKGEYGLTTVRWSFRKIPCSIST